MKFIYNSHSHTRYRRYKAIQQHKMTTVRRRGRAALLILSLAVSALGVPSFESDAERLKDLMTKKQDLVRGLAEATRSAASAPPSGGVSSPDQMTPDPADNIDQTPGDTGSLLPPPPAGQMEPETPAPDPEEPLENAEQDLDATPSLPGIEQPGLGEVPPPEDELDATSSLPPSGMGQDYSPGQDEVPAPQSPDEDLDGATSSLPGMDLEPGHDDLSPAQPGQEIPEEDLDAISGLSEEEIEQETPGEDDVVEHLPPPESFTPSEEPDVPPSTSGEEQETAGQNLDPGSPADNVETGDSPEDPLAPASGDFGAPSEGGAEDPSFSDPGDAPSSNVSNEEEPGVEGGCRDDADCSGNGVCKSKLMGERKCLCNPGFFGDSCAGGCEIFTDCASCVEPKRGKRSKKSSYGFRRRLEERFSGRASRQRRADDFGGGGLRSPKVYCGWSDGQCVESGPGVSITCGDEGQPVGFDDQPQQPVNQQDQLQQDQQQLLGDEGSPFTDEPTFKGDDDPEESESSIADNLQEPPVGGGGQPMEEGEEPKSTTADLSQKLNLAKDQIVSILHGDPDAMSDLSGLLIPGLGVLAVLALLCLCFSRCCKRTPAAPGGGAASMPYKKIPTQEPKQDVEEPALVEEKPPAADPAEQRRAEREARRDALRAKREAAQQGRTRKPSKGNIDTDDADNSTDQSRLLGSSRIDAGFQDSFPTKAPSPPAATARPPPRRKEESKPPPPDDPFANLGISAKPKFGEGGRAAVVVGASKRATAPVKKPQASRPMATKTKRSTAAPAKATAKPAKKSAPAAKAKTPTADSLMDLAAWDRDDDLDDILNG